MNDAQQLFAQMYNQNQAQGQAGPGPDMGGQSYQQQSGQNSNAGDDVVDGDYREV